MALASARLLSGASCSGRAVPAPRSLGPAAAGVRPSRSRAACQVAAEDQSSRYVLANGIVDYYEVLGVDDDARVDEIKKAYRSLAKECHPDYLGDRGHDICILLNEAYQVLSDPEQRSAYNTKLEQALLDDDDNYTGQPLSKWMPTVKPKMAKNTNPNETRAVFVDEFTCIGCKQCVWAASATFRIEPEHGRSRVYAQWLDDEDKIQSAIESCPVSCIHWVEKADLAALEYVMQVRMTQRTNVGVMMAGQGATGDVFASTVQFLKERKRKEEARARAAQYSPQQEAARRRAAQELAKQNGSFFGQFASAWETAFAGMAGVVSVDGNDMEDLKQVGRRKRSDRSRWDWLEKRRAAGGWMVPPERALVPISLYAESLNTNYTS